MAEDASALENSSAEALMSMKEGKGNSYLPSPRRGHPVRIRKPNPRIFGQNEEDAGIRSPRPRKQSRPQKTLVVHTPDKKAAQSTGVRLRNLLKLPKAHKWVCYEWFYANIDVPLFHGENDFCICLRESFPQLKTRKLTKVQWGQIRRLMGKARRCSSAFFTEERGALQKKRERIRMLQQRKHSDLQDFKDLPDEIPMPLVIGTKVTARLRRPQDGLFTGVIDALDTVNNTYRISFDRPVLGTQSVADVEVLSNEPQETIPLSAFQSKQRPNRQMLFSPPRYTPGQRSPELVGDNDPLLGSDPLKGSLYPTESGTLGGFPVRFLILVTRLTKILALKKERINELKELNAQAEKLVSTDNCDGKPFDMPFQQKYASIVLELEKLNKDLNEYLIGVQLHYQKIAPEQGVPTLDQASEIKKKNYQEAEELTKKANMAPGRKMVRNDRMLDLVAKLTSLLLQVRTFSENNMHSFEFKSLQDSLSEIKGSIDPSNISVFQNNVEIHINHLQSGMSQMGNLHAFASTSIPASAASSSSSTSSAATPTPASSSSAPEPSPSPSDVAAADALLE